MCEFYIKNLDLNNNTYPEDITGYQNYTYNDNYILKNIFKLNYYNSSLSKTYNFVSDIKEDFYTQLYSFDKDPKYKVFEVKGMKILSSQNL